MTKRKRHDSLCSSTTTTTDIAITSHDRDDTPNDHATEREKVVGEKEQCLKSEESVAKKTKEEECQEPETDKNVLVLLSENVNLVNVHQKESSVTPATESTTTNFAIRRKSNRILSLKRYNLSNVGCSSTEEQTPAQTSSKQLNNETTQSSQATSNSSSDAQVSSSSSTATSGNNQQSKGARKVQVWTADDTRWFFEALCEHGKDFPHIVSYIAARCEKKGIPAESIKNYEQVRHYYYRMWHKISQMLKISNEVEKGVQELYGLINYGELWKKFGSKFDLRLSASLQQLVDVGYTVFKMKGKSVRVRTPVCNALKRIHNIDSKAVSKPLMPPIPKEIDVELLPQTNADWMRVHSLAQNPRLRTKLSMQHRLTTLISYLERRWSLTRVTRNASNLQSLTTEEENNNDALSAVKGKSTNLSVIEKGDDAATAKHCDNGLKSIKKTERTFGIRLRPTSSEKLIERLQLKGTNHTISVSNFRSTTNTNAQTDLSLSAYLKNLYNAENGGANNAGGNDGKGGKSQFKMRKYSRKTTSAATTSSAAASNSDGDAKTKEDQNKSEQNSEQKDGEEEMEPPRENQVLNLFKMLDSMNAELAMPLTACKVSGTTSIINSSPEKSNPASTTETTEKPMDSRENNDLSPSDNFLQLFHPPEHTTLGQWLAGESGEKSDEMEASGQTCNISPPSESSKSGGSKSRRRGSLYSSEFTVLTSNEARHGWTMKEAESISIGELYLLFSRPAKIVLEYSWEEVKIEEEEEIEHKKESEEEDEQQQSQEDKSAEHPVTDMLQKLLIAANISLSKLKKPVNNLTTTNANSLDSAAASGAGNKGSRKRSAKVQTSPPPQPSLLLSNLIHKTILMDSNSNDALASLTPTTSTNIVALDNSNVIAGTQQQQPPQLIVIPSNGSLSEQLQLAKQTTVEQFVVPKRPAPRTASSQSTVAASMLQPKPTGGRIRNNMTILDDPSKVEVALSSLKDGNKMRQRRFMHNLQSKVLGTNSSPNKPQPAINGMERNTTASVSISSAKSKQSKFVVALSTSQQKCSSSVEGQPSLKPILLTTKDLLANQLPQETPKTLTLAAPSIVVPFLAAASTDILPPQQQQLALTLESSTPKVPLPSIVISPPTDAAAYQQQMVTTTIATTSFSALTAVSISSSSPNETGTKTVEVNSNNFVQFVNTSPKVLPSGTSTEELSCNNSQFSWFNEHNTDSMSSLLAACDIVANEELQRASTASDSVSMSLNSEFDTHVNAMVNDNSVDLMAKFADLAAHISADSRHAL